MLGKRLRIKIYRKYLNDLKNESEETEELKNKISELEKELEEKCNNRLHTIPTESLIHEIYNRMAENVEKGKKYDKLLKKHKKASKIIAELKSDSNGKSL